MGPMDWALALGAMIGLGTVLQGGLNRRIAGAAGLTQAALLNAVITLVVVAVLVLIVRLAPQRFPEFFRSRGWPEDAAWWYVLPGVCGVLIVVGVPLAISRIGASKTFLLMMSFQMLGSLFWDASIEAKPINLARVIGVALAFLGSAIVAFRG